ncbi:MAG: arylsulfatase [Bacteroidota bacterium]
MSSTKCFLYLFFPLVALGFFSCAEKAELTLPQPPNVIIILTDDQAWGDLSFHGNSNLSTPHIDSLALSGAVMENFYVQPVCSPTRAEILTGQYFPRLGVYDTSAGGERMDLGVPTIAEVFKAAGYTTAAYGKWHNGTQPPYHPNARGFDEYYGFCSGHWGNYFNPMLEHNGTIVKGKGFLVDDLFEHAIDFISKQKEKPFLVYLPVNTPHSPMQVPDRFWNGVKDRALEMAYHGSEKEDKRFTRAALAMVENIDWNVGRLTKFLQENDLEENTIVVYMSDNGPAGWRWNGNLRGKKGSTDEGGVKSPFFIKWPKRISAGTKSQQLMGSVDLLPTLAGLTQIPIPETSKIDGTDMSTSIINSTLVQPNKIVYNHWNNKTSVRNQNFRLDHQNRLYDIVNDPGQTQDRATTFPETRDTLIALKEMWLKEVKAYKKPKGKRRFPLGDKTYGFALLPARDGSAHGKIRRSNRWPNASFFTNWVQETDSITWDVEVLNDSHFEVYLYYSCSPEDIGTTLELSLNNTKIAATINEAHDPPLIGKKQDRFPRIESYVKEFKPVKMGVLTADKGIGNLSLKATSIPGDTAIDFRMLYFKRIVP